MNKLLHALTDRVSTKKGMWITLSIWLIATILLTVLAPGAKEYEVTRIDSLPKDAQSIIAQGKVDEYFEDNDGMPAILVFESDSEIDYNELARIFDRIQEENIYGVDQVIPLSSIPQQALSGFFSEDGTAATIPLIYESTIETTGLRDAQEQIYGIVEELSDYTLYVTGPAGIAVDSLDLFSRADLVLIFSTVGLILILLVVIYRSPLLALIPLLAAGFVYQVVMQTLGIMGAGGLIMSNQTLSIMMILLFAAVIDYSLFVFSRFREELKVYEDKYTAMKVAMRETGVAVFFAGSTVLAAMLVLFFAEFGDYNNFAPTFSTALVIIILASVTLVPALFTLFGRKSFWPKIPKVGDSRVKEGSIWSKVGRFVANKPGLAVGIMGVFLLISAANIFNLQYEFDTMKSFPEDMPSRVGYEILEEKFEKGDLAPTTVLFEGNSTLSEEQQEDLRLALEAQKLVNAVRINGTAEEEKVIDYSLTFEAGPYDVEAIDAMEAIIESSEKILADINLDGELYFAGETASLVDDRIVNDRDVLVIVLLETILIFVLLIFLTKSIRMPIYMMGTILVSFVAALGLGMFLTDLLFGIDTISSRVPLYAFVFLVALGIDYNIILISRFQEERKQHTVKVAIEKAVASTGGVISSAGIILAATFAVLMTQPVQLLFVFGFIVAIGILLDTFLIRGVLLPGLIMLFEKDKKVEKSN